MPDPVPVLQEKRRLLLPHRLGQQLGNPFLTIGDVAYDDEDEDHLPNVTKSRVCGAAHTHAPHPRTHTLQQSVRVAQTCGAAHTGFSSSSPSHAHATTAPRATGYDRTSTLAPVQLGLRAHGAFPSHAPHRIAPHNPPRTRRALCVQPSLRLAYRALQPTGCREEHLIADTATPAKPVKRSLLLRLCSLACMHDAGGLRSLGKSQI